MTRIELFVPANGAAFRDSLKRHGLQGVIIENVSVEGRAFDASQVAMAVVTFGANVAAGIVAAAIYDAVKGSGPWMRLNRKKVDVTPESILDAVELAVHAQDANVEGGSDEDRSHSDE